MIQIIYNSQCPHCRKVLQYLDEQDVKFNLHDITKKSLTLDEIKSIVKKLQLKPQELLSNTNKIKNSIGLDITTMTEEELCNILYKDPNILDSPIILKGNTAILGNCFENIKILLQD